MKNCEDVDLSGKNVGYLGDGVTGVQMNSDEDIDPPEHSHPCFGDFRWINGWDKKDRCRKCAYFGRCYIETVFNKDADKGDKD